MNETIRGDMVTKHGIKRAFYTKPLAAAWMIRYHAMKFIRPCCADFEPPYSIAEMLYYEESIFNGTTHIRFRIHPDSLHMIEPQAGDGGIDTNGFQCKFIKGAWVLEHPICEAANVETICNVIDKRNGIIFHWPEIRI